MKNTVVELALGRIFRLASRPEQPGDVAEYERCRALILDELDPFDPLAPPRPDYTPSLARNRWRGAEGQW